MGTVVQYVGYLAILVLLGIPLGAYIKKVMDGEKTFLSRILTPCENARVQSDARQERRADELEKIPAQRADLFNGIGLVFLFLLQLLQGVLPGNPQGLPGVKWDLSFNTAVSFVTNTNWQAYTRRVHVKLSVPGAWPDGAELCFRRHRYRGAVRPDPRFYQGKDRRTGELLGGYDENRRPYPDSAQPGDFRVR